MNRQPRQPRRAARAARSESHCQSASDAIPDAAHRECDRLLKAIEHFFDVAVQRSWREAMHSFLTIARGFCIVVMPIPKGEKPSNEAERRLNARFNVAALDLVIADFRDRGDEQTARTLEQIGPSKLPVVAYVPVHAALTQCAVGCIEYRVLSPGGSA